MLTTFVDKILNTLAEAERQAVSDEEAEWQTATLALMSLWNDHCDRCAACEKFNHCEPVGPRCSQGEAIWNSLARHLLTRD